jgi:hypothetical protein
MDIAIPPLGSPVHVLYIESEAKTLLDVGKRETLGWLIRNTGKDIYIQHDKTVGIRIPILSLVKICVVDGKESN